MIAYYALHADHESSQIICQCRSGNKWLEALRAVLSLPTCSIFSLSVALATAWITEFFFQDPRNTETRRGFFGDVGMAFPKRLDCSLSQIRHHRTFHTACVFVFRASNFRKTPQITKKITTAGPWHSGCIAKTTPIFTNAFTIVLSCNHQLASSACLRRSASSSAFAPSVGPEKIQLPIQQPWRQGSSTVLVGGFNPFEKYDRQIGSFPQVGVKIKNIWNHHLVFAFPFRILFSGF